MARPVNRSAYPLPVAVAVLICATLTTGARCAEPDPVPPGCTGGVASNPSLEETFVDGPSMAPQGYVVTGAIDAVLDTDSDYTKDGTLHGVLSTSDGHVAVASSLIPFAAQGAVYDLTVWAGTHDAGLDQQVGLRAYDAMGARIAETAVQADHDVDTDGDLLRLDLPGFTAPAGTASVEYFAQTGGGRVRWDCVHVNVAAYEMTKEVQDPATDDWGTIASLRVGDAANYRVTVSNVGTRPLSDIIVADSWCDEAPVRSESDLFALEPGKERVIICRRSAVSIGDDGRVATSMTANVTYPGGTLPGKSTSAEIHVSEGGATRSGPVSPIPAAEPPREPAVTGIRTIAAVCLSVLAGAYLLGSGYLLISIRRKRRSTTAASSRHDR